MPLNSKCAVTALWLWTANIDGILDQCQPTVYDAGPALIQRCVDVSMSPDSSHHLRSLSWSSLAYMSTKIVYRLNITNDYLHPSKHETFTQWLDFFRWFNGGPALQMLAQTFKPSGSAGSDPANTTHLPNVWAMLGQRRRRWANIACRVCWVRWLIRIEWGL